MDWSIFLNLSSVIGYICNPERLTDHWSRLEFLNNELKNCTAVCFQVDKSVYIPLLIAAGGGGRGYNGHSESSMELMDHGFSVPGLNGMSGAAGEATSEMPSLDFLVWIYILSMPIIDSFLLISMPQSMPHSINSSRSGKKKRKKIWLYRWSTLFPVDR